MTLTVALHVWSSSELILAGRELIQSESSAAQILSNDSILTFQSFVAGIEYRKRCLLFIPLGILIFRVSKRWRREGISKVDKEKAS